MGSKCSNRCQKQTTNAANVHSWPAVKLQKSHKLYLLSKPSDSGQTVIHLLSIINILVFEMPWAWKLWLRSLKSVRERDLSEEKDESAYGSEQDRIFPYSKRWVQKHDGNLQYSTAEQCHSFAFSWMNNSSKVLHCTILAMSVQLQI